MNATRTHVVVRIWLGLLPALLTSCASGGGGGGGPSGADENASAELEAQAPVGALVEWGCAGPVPEAAGVSLIPHHEDIPAVAVPRIVSEAERPAQVDLSDHVPTPCNQGILGSCTAWAAGYGLMTYLAAYNIDGWVGLDDGDHQFSPAFIFNQANSFRTGQKDYESCTEAKMYAENAFTLLRDMGCATWVQMPYTAEDCETQPDEDAMKEAADFKITYWETIVHDEVSVKSYLYEDIPVIAVVNCGDVFCQLERGDVYDTVDSAEGFKHAVLVVGYDEGLEAFKIMNSWSTDWGDEGFGFIAYDIWEDVVTHAYIVGNYLNSSQARERETAAKSSRLAQSNDLYGGCDFNPLFDSDGDGYPDSVEINFARFGFDPNVPDE